MSPQNTKRAVQYGTAIRLRRICSSDIEYEKKSKEYKAYLASCGHNPNELVETFTNVGNIPRSEARIRRVDRINEGPKKHRFFTNYNPHHPNIHKIIATLENI